MNLDWFREHLLLSSWIGRRRALNEMRSAALIESTPRTVLGSIEDINPGPPRRRYVLADIREGCRLGDALRIGRLLGHGGMGAVHLAHHEHWDLDVAVKVPNANVVERHWTRVVGEAEAWTRLGLHPHIAYCYYVHTVESIPVVVVEYVDGGSLRQWMDRRRKPDLKESLDIAIQVAHGLEHAHGQGLIHRDVKPANVLLSTDGTVKVTDFGIARFERADDAERGTMDQRSIHTRPGMGDELYMPPEQWRAAHSVTARADIFCFGVCLYELFCGRRPYDALQVRNGQPSRSPDPRAWTEVGLVPDDLCRLMQQCVEWLPDDRPQTGAVVRKQLCAIYEATFGRPSLWAQVPETSLEPGGWNNRGISFLEVDRAEDALGCFEEALTANPLHLEATYNLALLQWRRGVIDDVEVVSRLNRLIGVPAVDPTALALALAEVHFARHDVDAARAALASNRGLYESRLLGREPSRVEEHRSIKAHTTRAAALAVSRDGSRALSGGDDVVKLWNLKDDVPFRELSGHRWPVSSVALAPEGESAVSGSLDGTVKFWRGPSWQSVPFSGALGHKGNVNAVALASAADRALSAGDDHVVKLWNLRTGECVLALSGHTDAVLAVALDPGATLGVSAGTDRTVRVWDLKTGRCIHTLLDHEHMVTTVAVTPDRRLILSGSWDTTLKLWNAESGELIRTLRGHRQGVNAVAVSATGRFALSGGWDTTVKLWDVGSGRCLRTLDGHSQSVTSVALAAEVGRAVSAGDDGTMRIWDMDFSRASSPRHLPSRPHGFAEVRAQQQSRQRATTRAEELLADGRLREACETCLRTWSERGFADDDRVSSLYGRLLALGTPMQLQAAVLSFLTRERGVLGAIATDGRVVVSGRENGLDLWSLNAAKERVVLPTDAAVTCVGLSADGQRILAGDRSGHALVWNAQSHLRERTLVASEAALDGVAIAPDGRRGLTISEGGRTTLWDLSTGHRLSELRGADEAVRRGGPAPDAAAVHVWQNLAGEVSLPEGSHCTFLTADGRRGLRLLRGQLPESWDFEHQQRLHAFPGGKRGVTAVAMNAAGTAAVATAGAVVQWDITSGKTGRTIEAHADLVWAVAVDATGRRMVSSGGDRALRFWNIDTGECSRIVALTSNALSLVLAPDASWLLTSHDDGTLLFWRLVWSLEFGATGQTRIE